MSVARACASCVAAVFVATVLLGSHPAALPLSPQTFANKRKLGPEINTDERDAQPVVSPDGRFLYINREGSKAAVREVFGEANSAIDALEKQLANITDPALRKSLEDSIASMRKTSAANQAQPNAGLRRQDPWVSERQPDGRWGQAQKMPAPLSGNQGNTWIGTALPDNNTLLVEGLFRGTETAQWQGIIDQAQKMGDDPLQLILAVSGRGGANTPMPESPRLFGLTHRTASGWSAPEVLKMASYTSTGERFDVILAPDGRHLLFSIQNRESIGKRDLFVSMLRADGVWTKPANLGATVNTPGEEWSPVMAPDDRTLYFASDRPGGFGGFDLYATHRLDDSWLKWSSPKNLGAAVNTPENDTNIAVDATGRYAYMAIGPLMKEDIYEFALPPEMRPTPVAFVYGKVTDPSGRPLPASIVYEVLRTGAGAGQAASKPGDGMYQIALPIGDDYAFRAAAAGYIAVSDRVDLTAVKEGQRIERNLVLVPLDATTPIRLNNVFFDTAKTALLPESARELDRLIALLNEHSTMRIEVRGHTDSVDDDAFNQRLSEGRAASVVAYLTQHGIAASRLQSRGFGKTQPVAPNSTAEGRQLNRRVEFVILSR